MSATGINKITIDKITYTIVDTSKLEKPSVAGTVGQVLALAENGTEWVTVTNSTYNQGEGIIINNNTLTLNWDIVAKKDDIVQYSAGNNIEITSDSKINWVDNDYTAFEVFAHDYVIPRGECEELSGFVNYEIAANMTHMFTLRTMVQDTTKCDVVVDWGDGTISSVANMDFEQGEYADTSADTAAGEANYTFRHTYAKNGKYVVKIYGKHYYNINANLRVASKYLNSNIISRIFTWDLPIASHYRNLSQMCAYADNLLFINVETLKYEYFVNVSGLFASCYNLLEAIGFKLNFITACAANMFINCFSLKKTDMQLATKSVYANAGYMLYRECRELAVDISKLIPEVQGSSTIDVSYLFSGCAKLTGTVPASKLWGNTNVIWTNTDTAFIGCSDEIRAQVPVSWGGTASDDLIKKDYIYFGIPDESQINANQYLLLDIDFSNTDDFSSVVSYTQTDCQLFNPSTGTWIDVPSDGIDLAMASSYLRMPYPSTAYSNCRYRWRTTDGSFGSYNTVII